MDIISDKTRSYLHLWENHSSGIRFGHISLELCNCYISFWPEKGTTSCQILNDICPAKWYNTVKEEISENGQKGQISLLIYDLDEARIKSWWEKFKSRGPKYDLRTKNCASIVYTALCEGTSWFGENIKECSGIKTPRLVFQYVKNGFNQKKKIDYGCLCTHCVSLFPYTTFGFFSFHTYNLYLCLSSIRQYIKCIKPDQYKAKVESDEQLLLSSQTKATVVTTICEDAKDTKNPVEEESLDNFIDLSFKRAPKVVSLSTKSFLSQPSDESHIETVDPSVIDLGIRFRAVTVTQLEAEEDTS